MDILLRRFLGILMKRIVNFFHAQQLVVPVCFFASFEIWQYATGRLTAASFRQNPLNEFLPYITTIGLLLVVELLLAARDLNGDLSRESQSNRPLIIHEDNRVREPSKIPAYIVAGVFIAFIVLGEWSTVEHGYPTYSIAIRPKLPDTPMLPVPPIAVPPKPPKLHVVGYAASWYEVGKPLKIKMFIDNMGGLPETISGTATSRFVDNLPFCLCR